MTTHRSLNKLEFKAHMSIHNMVDVPENESRDTNFTRDRFGKRHLLVNEDGTPRIRIKRLPVALIFLFLVSMIGPLAHAEDERRNRQLGPNVQMTSEEIGSAWDRLPTREKDEEFSFVKSGDTALGFNENGDPSLSTRF